MVADDRVDEMDGQEIAASCTARFTGLWLACQPSGPAFKAGYPCRNRPSPIPGLQPECMVADDRMLLSCRHPSTNQGQSRGMSYFTTTKKTKHCDRDRESESVVRFLVV